MSGDCHRMEIHRASPLFVLKPEEVDKLRDAARRILTRSKDLQRLLGDLR